MRPPALREERLAASGGDEHVLPPGLPRPAHGYLPPCGRLPPRGDHGESFGTSRTTNDDAFPFFPLAPDDAEAVASDAGVTGRAGAGAGLAAGAR